MNNREAIDALLELPAIERIAKMSDLQPDDVIVVECHGVLSQEAVDRITQYTQDVWPGRRVVVLANGIRLKVMPGSTIDLLDT